MNIIIKIKWSNISINPIVKALLDVAVLSKQTF